MTRTLDEKTIEILRKAEPKYIRALELYYSNFGDENGLTFNEAAHKAGVNTAFLVNYIEYCDAYIGIPDDRENAVEYLKNLEKYKLKKSL